MCGAQTGSHPSAASRGSSKAGSLRGKQIPTLFEWNCARISSTFPEEVLGILAGLEPLLVPLRSPAGQGTPGCATAAVPGWPCLCPSPRDSSRLCQGPSELGRAFGWWELERCTDGTWDLRGLFWCCAAGAAPKHSTHHPLGLLWPEVWSENTSALQGLSQPCMSPLSHHHGWERRALLALGAAPASTL